MIQLIQFPWSPFCLVIQRILEYGRIQHEVTNIPPSDRSLIWNLTRQRYYQVPVIKDGKDVLFETDEGSQVIAKYLDSKFDLGLFPRELEGLQEILWRYIEQDVEDMTFRMNDAYYQDFVPAEEQWAYVRHKERKFGKGCLKEWRARHGEIKRELTGRLRPFESMLRNRPYLISDQPSFVDFDLWGMIANYQFSGQHRLPAANNRLRQWHRRLEKATKGKG